MHASRGLERWKRSFALIAKRHDDDEWRHELAGALREAIGCTYVTVHTDVRMAQQASWPIEWDRFMQGLRERFLPRIEAVGEGIDYAMRRYGLVYAPLEVASDEQIRSEMSETLLDAGVRGYAVAFFGRGFDGLIAIGDDGTTPKLLERAGPGLLGLAEVAKLATRRPATRVRGVTPVDRLTPRERQVAALLSEGHSNLNVSAHLDMAEQTVAVHVRAIYRKLGVHSRVELARRLMDAP